jgi:hypothetical protein
MDEMRIEILPDGTIKTTTDPISPANHQSADAFVNELARLTGGATTKAKRGHSHTHTHTHTHVERKA